LSLSAIILAVLLVGAFIHGAAIVYLGGFVAAIIGALLPTPGFLSKDQRVKVMSAVLCLANAGVTLWLWEAMEQTWGR
jgi:hypothetical protein